jgi:hypothetical protein
MMDFEIERVWNTISGYKAVILIIRESHRCGYVGIPENHPDFSKDYDDIPVDVHGGLTFADEEFALFNKEHLWWLGFDCAHWGDGSLNDDSRGEPKSLEFCVKQCEILAFQLLQRSEGGRW